MRRVRLLLAAFALVLVAPRARAQDASASAADALFQSGKDAMAHEDYDAACARFRESFRLQAAVGTLLNLGACEDKRGHPAFALQCFRDSLALLSAGDFRRPYVEEQLLALRPRVAAVRLRIEGTTPNAIQLSQDNVTLSAASLGIEFVVDPGPHVFAASAAGYEPERHTLVLSEGEHRDVVFRLRAVKAPSTDAPPAPPAAPSRGGSLAPWLLVGSGAAAVVVGGAFGLVVVRAASEVRDHCDGSGCDDTGVRAAERGRPYALLSPVLVGSGIALAGTGAAWLLFFRSPRLRPSAVASPHGGMATLGGTF